MMGLEGKDLKSLMDMIQSKMGNGAEVQMFAVSGDEMEEVKSMEDLQRLVQEKGASVGCSCGRCHSKSDDVDYGKLGEIAEGMAHLLEEHNASVGDYMHASVALLCSRLHSDFEAKTGGDEEAYSTYLQDLSKSIAVGMMRAPISKAHSSFDVAIALMMVGKNLIDVEEQISTNKEVAVVSQKKAERKAFIEELKKALDDLS